MTQVWFVIWARVLMFLRVMHPGITSRAPWNDESSTPNLSIPTSGKMCKVQDSRRSSDAVGCKLFFFFFLVLWHLSGDRCIFLFCFVLWRLSGDRLNGAESSSCFSLPSPGPCPSQKDHQVSIRWRYGFSEWSCCCQKGLWQAIYAPLLGRGIVSRLVTTRSRTEGVCSKITLNEFYCYAKPTRTRVQRPCFMTQTGHPQTSV